MDRLPMAVARTADPRDEEHMELAA
jgi:hypothetical protein